MRTMFKYATNSLSYDWPRVPADRVVGSVDDGFGRSSTGGRPRGPCWPLSRLAMVTGSSRTVDVGHPHGGYGLVDLIDVE